MFVNGMLKKYPNLKREVMRPLQENDFGEFSKFRESTSFLKFIYSFISFAEYIFFMKGKFHIQMP